MSRVVLVSASYDKLVAHRLATLAGPSRKQSEQKSREPFKLLSRLWIVLGGGAIFKVDIGCNKVTVFRGLLESLHRIHGASGRIVGSMSFGRARNGDRSSCGIGNKQVANNVNLGPVLMLAAH